MTAYSNNKVFSESQRDIPKGGNIVLTAFFNSAVDPQRNIKWTADIDLITGLSKSCEVNNENIIIFHDCFSPEQIQKIQSSRVFFYKVKFDTNYSPNVFRYLIMYDFLIQHTYDKVFIVDSYDVIMQFSPFAEMLDGFIYCGDEAGKITGLDWMRETQEPYLKIPDYRKIIENHADKRLLNCGLVGCYYNDMLKLLSLWTDIFKNSISDTHAATDMATFNYIIRKYYQGRFSHGIHVNTGFKLNKENNISWWKHK